MSDNELAQDPMLHPEEVEGAPRRPGRWVQWTMYGLALGLLAGCIWVGYGEFKAGWGKLRHASGADLGFMVVMLGANLVLDAFVFWAVLVPFRPPRPVALREMVALIAATSLLNYLPMRAGMIGRAAYLKQRHGVSYHASVVMMLGVAAATVLIYLLLLVLTVWFGDLGPAWWASALAGLALMAWLMVVVLRYGRRWAPKAALHYFDDAHAAIGWLDEKGIAAVAGAWVTLVARTLGIVARGLLLWTAARVFGTPIEPGAALVLAICGTFVTLATPLPNGLGLREGIYGLLAAAGVAGAALPDGPTGVALGLIERAMEALVFIVVGTVGLLYVHRRTATVASQPS